MSNEIVAPCIMPDATSRPSLSVPNQWYLFLPEVVTELKGGNELPSSKCMVVGLNGIIGCRQNCSVKHNTDLSFAIYGARMAVII